VAKKGYSSVSAITGGKGTAWTFMRVGGWREGSRQAWVLLDSSDAEHFGQHRWSCGPHGTAVRAKDGRSEVVLMHREIMKATDRSVQVDHRNHDQRDNRRLNLRITTNAENNQNRAGAYRDSTSKYRGVWWDRSRGRWSADVRVGDMRFRLGRFDNEEEAAEAARECRLEHMPFTVEANG
jgi:hypothetical protein